MAYQIGIVEWAFPFPGPHGLKIAEELGLDGMELDFGDYETGFPLSNPRIQQAYLECGEKYHIAFPSMALNALNAHGMSHDRDSFEGLIAIETIRAGLKAAHDMGIPVVQLPSFDSGDIRTERDFYNTCEKMRLACDLAESLDLTIAAENVLSVEHTKKLLQEVNSPRLKVMYDTQNYYLDRGYSQMDILCGLQKHIVQIHIKDGYNGTISSALLGRGDVGFAETAAAIKRAGCTEWLLLENYYNKKPLSLLDSDPFTLLSRDIKTVRALFS